MYVTSCMDMTSQEVPGGSQGARRSVRTTGEVHIAYFSFFPSPFPTFFCFYSPTAGRTLLSQTSADRGRRDADIGDEKMIKSLRFLKDATTLTLRAQGPQGQRCQHVNVHRQNRAITTAITTAITGLRGEHSAHYSTGLHCNHSAHHYSTLGETRIRVTARASGMLWYAETAETERGSCQVMLVRKGM